MDGYAFRLVRRAGYCVLLASGEIDRLALPTLRERLEVALAEGERAVIVDLAAVTFVDAGLLAFLDEQTARAAAGRWHLLISSPPAFVLRLLRAVELDRALVLAATLEEAETMARRLSGSCGTPNQSTGNGGR